MAQWEQAEGTSPSTSNLVQVAAMTGVCFEWLATGRGPIRVKGHEFDMALTLGDYARDELESRVLDLMRRLPNKKRKVACEMLALFVG